MRSAECGVRSHVIHVAPAAATLPGLAFVSCLVRFDSFDRRYGHREKLITFPLEALQFIRPVQARCLDQVESIKCFVGFFFDDAHLGYELSVRPCATGGTVIGPNAGSAAHQLVAQNARCRVVWQRGDIANDVEFKISRAFSKEPPARHARLPQRGHSVDDALCNKRPKIKLRTPHSALAHKEPPARHVHLLHHCLSVDVCSTG